MPTLTDVARQAGVSLSTASRAFSSPDRIGAATLRRIRDAADDLGYAVATSRANAGTLTIAVVVPDIGNPVWSDFVKAAQSQSFFNDNVLVLVDTDGAPERERTLIANLTSRVDAFIVCSPRNDADDVIALCGDAPVVLVNRQSEHCNCVVPDAEIGLRQATDYLHALGHSQIAYVQGSPHSWSNNRRITAMTQLAEERGVELNVLGWQDESVAGGQAAAASIVASGASAVITHNDPMALGVIKGLRTLGIRVPEDVSVIGTDGSSWTELTNPSLSSIHVPMARSAVLSTSLVHRALADRDHPDQERAHVVEHLPTQFVVGGSSGPAPHRAIHSTKELQS